MAEQSKTATKTLDIRSKNRPTLHIYLNLETGRTPRPPEIASHGDI